MQNLTDLGSTHDAFRAMLAEADSVMTNQHLSCCCLWSVSYRTASSPLSIKKIFFKVRLDAPFFSRTIGCCLSCAFSFARVLQPEIPPSFWTPWLSFYAMWSTRHLFYAACIMWSTHSMCISNCHLKQQAPFATANVIWTSKHHVQLCNPFVQH
jgi:hypothetical protein